MPWESMVEPRQNNKTLFKADKYVRSNEKLLDIRKNILNYMRRVQKCIIRLIKSLKGVKIQLLVFFEAKYCGSKPNFYTSVWMQDQRPNHDNNTDAIRIIAESTHLCIIANGGSSNNRNSPVNTHEGNAPLYA